MQWLVWAGLWRWFNVCVCGWVKDTLLIIITPHHMCLCVCVCVCVWRVCVLLPALVVCWWSCRQQLKNKMWNIKKRTALPPFIWYEWRWTLLTCYNTITQCNTSYHTLHSAGYICVIYVLVLKSLSRTHYLILVLRGCYGNFRTHTWVLYEPF